MGPRSGSRGAGACCECSYSFYALFNHTYTHTYIHTHTHTHNGYFMLTGPYTGQGQETNASAHNKATAAHRVVCKTGQAH